MTPDNPAILDVDGLIADFQTAANRAGVGYLYKESKENPEILDDILNGQSLIRKMIYGNIIKDEINHLKNNPLDVMQELIKGVEIFPKSKETIEELSRYFDVSFCTDNLLLGNPEIGEKFRNIFSSNGKPNVSENYATRSARVVDGQFRIELNGKKEDYVLGKLDGAEYGLVVVEGKNDVGVAKSVKEKHPEACVVQVGNNCYDFEGYVDHKFENIGDILSHPEILTKSE